MALCPHDLAERESAWADGYCPLCSAAEARVPVEFFGARPQIRARIGDWRLLRVEDAPNLGVAIYTYDPPKIRASALRAEGK